MSSENSLFENRVFGAIVIKSINSNFNADFTHQPRTLPDGVVYATDKALKYAIKDYLKNNFPEEKIFFTKRFNESLNPLTLDETYKFFFKEYPKIAKKTKKPTKPAKEEKSDESSAEGSTAIFKLEVLKNLLTFLDIRLFGATFAGETNISIHGPVQINHGVNKFPENEIYSEDILSPFRNPGKDDESEKGMSTIGNQTNLKEGHYVYFFSVNPVNILDYVKLIKSQTGNESNTSINGINARDISLLKESFTRAVTALDSSRKINTENEMLLWITLKEKSKKVFPSFTELIDISRDDKNQVIIDCTKLNPILKSLNEDIKSIELYYDSNLTQIKGISDLSKEKLQSFHLSSMNKIT